MNDKDQQRVIEALEAIAQRLKRLDDIKDALDQIRHALAMSTQRR